MIEETAVVTRVGDRRVWIKSQPNGACGGCRQQATCGTATLAKALPKREFAVECDLALHVGDRVRVAIDDAHVLLSAIVLYLAPLIFTLCGVGLAHFWLPTAQRDAWLPEITLALLLIAFAAIHRVQAGLATHWFIKPEIVGKAPPPLTDYEPTASPINEPHNEDSV